MVPKLGENGAPALLGPVLCAHVTVLLLIGTAALGGVCNNTTTAARPVPCSSGNSPGNGRIVHFGRTPFDCAHTHFSNALLDDLQAGELVDVCVAPCMCILMPVPEYHSGPGHTVAGAVVPRAPFDNSAPLGGGGGCPTPPPPPLVIGPIFLWAFGQSFSLAPLAPVRLGRKLIQRLQTLSTTLGGVECQSHRALDPPPPPKGALVVPLGLRSRDGLSPPPLSELPNDQSVRDAAGADAVHRFVGALPDGQLGGDAKLPHGILLHLLGARGGVLPSHGGHHECLGCVPREALHSIALDTPPPLPFTHPRPHTPQPHAGVVVRRVQRASKGALLCVALACYRAPIMLQVQGRKVKLLVSAVNTLVTASATSFHTTLLL